MNAEELTKGDQDELLLINIVEELVKDKIKEVKKTFDMCNCRICFLNACAIALNDLPPQYVTTQKGALLAELKATNTDFQSKVTVAVIKALMTVKEHPMH